MESALINVSFFPASCIIMHQFIFDCTIPPIQLQILVCFTVLRTHTCDSLWHINSSAFYSIIYKLLFHAYLVNMSQPVFGISKSNSWWVQLSVHAHRSVYLMESVLHWLPAGVLALLVHWSHQMQGYSIVVKNSLICFV